MARISGVNIPTNKRVIIALQYIHGIGATRAKRIVDAAAEHDAIIRALRAGDPESARRAVETNYGHGTAELTPVSESPEASDQASHARPLASLTLAKKRSDAR